MNTTNRCSAEQIARAEEQEHEMTDTEPTLEGIEIEPSKAAVFDDFLKTMLASGLVALDRMTLPPWDTEYATNGDSEAAHAEYYRDMHEYLWSATIAHVLIRVKENAPRIAEAIAAEVGEYLDAGDTYPEWIWQWATEVGLDPEKIKADAREKREAWLKKPVRVSKYMADLKAKRAAEAAS
jgi:hypothetical protein